MSDLRERAIEAVETAFGDADFRVTSDLTSPAHREAAAALAVDVVLPLVLAEVQRLRTALAAFVEAINDEWPNANEGEWGGRLLGGKMAEAYLEAERIRQIGEA